MSKAKELEHRLSRAEHQIRFMQRLSRYLVRDTDLDNVLQTVVETVVEFMECESCLLYLFDQNDEELVLRASNNPHPSVVGKIKLALNEGLTGWVARERRLLAISREAYHDARFKYFSDLPEDTFEAFLSAPVLSRDRIEGVINVQHRYPHSHSGVEMELLTSVGEMLGSLLMIRRLSPKSKATELVLS